MMRILNNRIAKVLIFMIVVIILNITGISLVNVGNEEAVSFSFTINAPEADSYQLFYDMGNGWNEEDSSRYDYSTPNKDATVEVNLPQGVSKIRLDLGDRSGQITLSHVCTCFLFKKNKINLGEMVGEMQLNDIGETDWSLEQIKIDRTGNDAYIVIDYSKLNMDDFARTKRYVNYGAKFIVFLLINALVLFFVKKRKVVMELGRELYRNRKLIGNLSKSDFKTRYAGSYLGITWAFIQPVVTVLVYWFVFQVGFKSAPVHDFPFLLWLISGMVPWFFFSEALINGTNSMIEYSYLVKKVVFKISILPIVKIISAFFVHLFFVAFTLLLYWLYGYHPHVYMLQVIYYTFCMFVYVLGMSYGTCAIIVFFKDLGQIISIFLQIGMWLTPIMWSYNMVPDKYQWILKINPMYYIVEGYRDALINKVWFWERFNQTIYFWVVAIGLFGIGSIIFKRLKVHFADVL